MTTAFLTKTSVLAAVLLGATTSASAQSTSVTPVPIDRNVLHVQVILDHLGFGPGVLDGRGGQSLVAALKGFQEAKGLPITGKPDTQTMRALYPYRAARPTVTVALTPEMLAGPFVNPLPKDPAKQAELQTIGYRTVMEKLGEMFHTTPAVIMALNSPSTKLSAAS
jgi:peptidoglycan hydrolase-like protein with peptidoglycan-binding domain